MGRGAVARNSLCLRSELDGNLESEVIDAINVRRIGMVSTFL
jgi:hypothetical protein